MLLPLPLTIWLIFAALVGGCIGSFLTVVVFRYPRMLYQEWEADCADFKQQTSTTKPTFNLAYPRSHCPHCQNPLKAWHNIPLLSFIMLRGKCSFCKHPISKQYALIEWLCAIMTPLCLWHWGLNTGLITPLLTGYALIALGVIDYNERLLPDALTLGLMWIGLLAHSHTDPGKAIIGAAGGYAVPWLINRLFMLIRHKPGMGHGDFKCLAAIGAWAGLTAAIGSYVLAAVLSLLVTLPLLMRKQLKLSSMLPFGPFICVSGWLWINFEPTLRDWLQQLLFF